MAQRPSDTILVAIRITLRIRESRILRIGGGLCSLSAAFLLKFCYLGDMLSVDGDADAAVDGINSGRWYHCLPIRIYH